MRGADGAFLANAALASGRDVRDAVAAARTAFAEWSGSSAYHRGQQLYRVAEIIADHRARFADEVGRAAGVRAAVAYAEVDAAVDRWLWYTGWTDKIAQVRGGVNAVAGPYVNITVPEPAWWRCSPRRTARCSGWSASSRPRSRGATRPSWWPANGTRCPRSAWPRSAPPPGCPTGW